MRRIIFVTVSVAFLLNGSGTSFGDQENDPNFDPKVARPAFAERHPLVHFDEAHFNFHTARGHYKPLADLLGSDGYRVESGKRKFAREALQGIDVLVIANAQGARAMDNPAAGNPAFTKNECEAVRQFVEYGGSLLLITDVPPFGSASEILGRRLGVEMSQALTLDQEHSAPGSDNPSQLVFSRENGLLGDHPITKGRDESERIDKVITFGGQSLQGPPGSTSYLTLAGTAQDYFSQERKRKSAAGRSQGVALRLGKGRMIVLGEAGQLSAQLSGPMKVPMGMNVPGTDNRKLALNMLHWLSGLLD